MSVSVRPSVRPSVVRPPNHASIANDHRHHNTKSLSQSASPLITEIKMHNATAPKKTSSNADIPFVRVAGVPWTMFLHELAQLGLKITSNPVWGCLASSPSVPFRKSVSFGAVVAPACTCRRRAASLSFTNSVPRRSFKLISSSRLPFDIKEKFIFSGARRAETSPLGRSEVYQYSTYVVGPRSKTKLRNFRFYLLPHRIQCQNEHIGYRRFYILSG